MKDQGHRMITADEFGCVYLERERTRSQDSIHALPDKPTVLRDPPD